MLHLIIGVVLLVGGAVASANTPTLFYGAILVGILEIGRGIVSLARN